MDFARQSDGEEVGLVALVLREARVVLDVARLAGIDAAVRDGTPKLTASTEPAAALIERLRQHRAGIIALLTPGVDGLVT